MKALSRCLRGRWRPARVMPPSGNVGEYNGSDDESDDGLEIDSTFGMQRSRRRQRALDELVTARACRSDVVTYIHWLVRYALRGTVLDGVEDLLLHIGGFLFYADAAPHEKQGTAQPNNAASLPLPPELLRAPQRAEWEAEQSRTRELAAELSADLVTLEAAGRLTTLAQRAARAGFRTTGNITLSPWWGCWSGSVPKGEIAVVVDPGLLQRDPKQSDSLVNLLQALGYCVLYGVRRRLGADRRPRYDPVNGTWEMRHSITLSWCTACGCPVLYARGRHYDLYG